MTVYPNCLLNYVAWLWMQIHKPPTVLTFKSAVDVDRIVNRFRLGELKLQKVSFWKQESWNGKTAFEKKSNVGRVQREMVTFAPERSKPLATSARLKFHFNSPINIIKEAESGQKMVIADKKRNGGGEKGIRVIKVKPGKVRRGNETALPAWYTDNTLIYCHEKNIKYGGVSVRHGFSGKGT